VNKYFILPLLYTVKVIASFGSENFWRCNLMLYKSVLFVVIIPMLEVPVFRYDLFSWSWITCVFVGRTLISRIFDICSKLVFISVFVWSVVLKTCYCNIGKQIKFAKIKKKKIKTCCILSFGWFPNIWILYADVSEHSVCSIFIGGVRCRGITQIKNKTFRTWRKFEIKKLKHH